MFNKAKFACGAFILYSLSTISFAAITVDGILTGTDTYSHTFNISLTNDGGNNLYEGILRIGFSENTDSTGGLNDLFLLLEVPTDVTDLTFGAYASPGWLSGPGAQAYSKIQGSEKWKFSLGNSVVELKLKDKDNDGAGLGYELKENGGGNVLAASTSLDHNIQTFGNTFIVDSPECGSTLGSPTDDADCYANPAVGASAYEFAQMYEMQISSSAVVGLLGDFSNLSSFISNAVIHASPPKTVSDNEKEFVPCSTVNPLCITLVSNPPDPNAIPEPTTISMFALACLGLFFMGKRRKTIT